MQGQLEIIKGFVLHTSLAKASCLLLCVCFIDWMYLTALLQVVLSTTDKIQYFVKALGIISGLVLLLLNVYALARHQSVDYVVDETKHLKKNIQTAFSPSS